MRLGAACSTTQQHVQTRPAAAFGVIGVVELLDHPCGCGVPGYWVASRGMLSAGPFAAETLGSQSGARQRKIWVASQRPGSDDAVLVVTGPDGRRTSQRRPTGQSSVPDARQYYPGSVTASTHGPYRIEVAVGTDRLCVIVRYRV